jgi:O-antigen ligase
MLLLGGKFDEIEAKGSFGKRYHMLLFGWEHAQRNLLFGLGPGVTEPLMKSEWTKTRPHSDLHNGYLEILLRLGLVGAALFLALLVLLVQGSWRAYRAQRIPWDLFLLLMTALALHLLGTLTNFRMLNIDWRHYWLLFGGILFSIHWFNRSSAPASSAKAYTDHPAQTAGSEAPSRLSR